MISPTGTNAISKLKPSSSKPMSVSSSKASASALYLNPHPHCYFGAALQRWRLLGAPADGHPLRHDLCVVPRTALGTHTTECLIREVLKAEPAHDIMVIDQSNASLSPLISGLGRMTAHPFFKPTPKLILIKSSEQPQQHAGPLADVELYETPIRVHSLLLRIQQLAATASSGS